MAITPETRDYRTFEVRALSADGSGEEQKYRVEGYAAVFDEETVLYEYDGIEYKEVIDRSAFTGAEMRDVVMNYNHGGKPVARTKNGTLQLTVDTRGLRISADLSGTEEGRRLYEEIRGGYLDQMSTAQSICAALPVSSGCLMWQRWIFRRTTAPVLRHARGQRRRPSASTRRRTSAAGWNSS